MTLWLARSAERYPHQAAIAHGTDLWCNYAPEYLPLVWGIWWCGAVAVPVNAKLREREVEEALLTHAQVARFKRPRHEKSQAPLGRRTMNQSSPDVQQCHP